MGTAQAHLTAWSLQANLVWSFATLESDDARPELMAILASALVQRIGDCNPQELSNTIWAFAKLRTPPT